MPDQSSRQPEGFHSAPASFNPLSPQTPEPVLLNPANFVGQSIIPPQRPLPPRSVFREYLLPLLLFSISLITTTAIGARYMQNFLDGLPTVTSENDLWPWPWLFSGSGQDAAYAGGPCLSGLSFSQGTCVPHLSVLGRFALGWPFSFTLLAILLTHEFGHFFACRVHKIRCTLPLVLPAPTLSGTAGAVIQIRGRIPNRQALLDVGIYGPLAGYAASLVAIAIGLSLSHPLPAGQPSPLLEFGQPLTLRLVHAVLVQFRSATPAFSVALRHPVVIAGWVGLFITALNLIPGGQLDGGHILYALSPRAHRIFTRILPFLLIACGFFFWVGWILWGIILWIPAMRHPAVPESQPLSPKRLILAAVALLIFVLTLSPAPFEGSSILHYIRHF